MTDERFPDGIYEITSSGLTHTWSSISEEPNRYRIGDLIAKLNYGLAEIDWENQEITFQIKGEGGANFDNLLIPFSKKLINNNMFKRREFLKSLGLSSAAWLSLGTSVLADPLPSRKLLNPFSAIRLRGKVSASGKGLSGVAVSDGRTIVLTDGNGEYELISSNDREFVFLSIPSGYQIEKQANGSAAFFQRINPNQGEQLLSFSLVPNAASDENHHFLLLSDTQIQDDYEAGQMLSTSIPDVQQTIARLNDANIFGIGCGDLVNDRLELFKEYNQGIAATGIPFFQVIGNHDMNFGVRSDEGTAKTFKGHFGPTYYSWNRGEVHYVVLDDVFYLGVGTKYIGYIPEEQLAWLEQGFGFGRKRKNCGCFLAYSHLHRSSAALSRPGYLGRYRK